MTTILEETTCGCIRGCANTLRQITMLQKGIRFLFVSMSYRPSWAAVQYNTVLGL